MSSHRNHVHRIKKIYETGYFRPKTWRFWRSLIACFCIFTIVGHWLELVYCLFMNHFFGIVADDYAIWIDPWYHPYWVYGVGILFMTFFIEPFKEYVLTKRKNMWSAVLITFVFAVVIAAVLECVIGFIVNQPNEFGKYPFWDNSQLPLNIFGQAWLVNDLVMGFMTMFYVWIFYPLICYIFERLSPKSANILLGVIVMVFAGCCIASYTELILNGTLGG